jgi:hypothetical protein
MLTREYLENKVKNLNNQLNIAQDKLYKITPQKPLVSDECTWCCDKKELVHRYTYSCSYCGEQVRLNSKKHKCGQIQDWNL